MNKLSFTGGAFLLFVIALLTLMTFTPQPAQSQVSGWSIEIIGLPRGGVVPLGDVVDASGELKVIPGMNARIAGPQGTPEHSVEVFLEAEVRGVNVQGFSKCNGVIATAITQKFRAPRTITANDFTGTGGIGIESDTQNEGCIDDLTDKRPSSLPAGQYFIKLTVRRNTTKEVLASTEEVIDVVAASVAEINARWIGPEGEITSTSPSIEVQADKAGKILIYEQTRPGQTAQEAITNTAYLCLELPFTEVGTVLKTYQYPGNARRPLQSGKTYFGFVRIQIEGIGGRSETKDSEIKSFYLKSADPVVTSLTNTLTSNAPPVLSGTFSNLISSGFNLNFGSTNPIKISTDGGKTFKTFDATQLTTYIQELTRNNTTLRVSLTD